MSQEQLGVVLGIQKAAVQKIESGQSPNISVEKLRVLCEEFNEFPSYFLYGSSEQFWFHVFNYSEEKDAQHTRYFLDNPYIAKIVDEVGLMGHHLAKDLSILNDEGIRRVLIYAKDMTKIKDYRKGD